MLPVEIAFTQAFQQLMVKNNFKQSILIAEMLVEKQFQGGSILIAEMLGSILTAEMLAKATSREAFQLQKCW